MKKTSSELLREAMEKNRWQRVAAQMMRMQEAVWKSQADLINARYRAEIEEMQKPAACETIKELFR